MNGETCTICGGDGRIGNSLGRSTATCPACHGSGRAAERSSGFHDVTKTKASHHHPAGQPAQGPKGPKLPATAMGTALAAEVSACATLPADAKARLVAEILLHESKHERCTETFVKKLRKQLKPHA